MASRCAPSPCNPSISSCKEPDFMEHAAANSLGFAHFLAQTDGVGRAVLATLLVLSVASWYLIVTRALANWLAQRRADAFVERFWQAHSIEAAAGMLYENTDNAFAVLVDVALKAKANGGEQNLAVAGGMAEYLTRTLNNAVDLRGCGIGVWTDGAGLRRIGRALHRAVRHGLGHLPRAGADRPERPGHAGQGGRAGGRGADHDGARAWPWRSPPCWPTTPSTAATGCGCPAWSHSPTTSTCC
jgi:hypothetical protein